MCPQYTPPTTAAEYVHRVGRTARIGGRGSSLLFLAPSEAAFVNELANHNIRFVCRYRHNVQSTNQVTVFLLILLLLFLGFSLMDLKLQNILSILMLDDTYKGRGKYHSQVRPGHLYRAKGAEVT